MIATNLISTFRSVRHAFLLAYLGWIISNLTYVFGIIKSEYTKLYQALLGKR